MLVNIPYMEHLGWMMQIELANSTATEDILNAKENRHSMPEILRARYIASRSKPLHRS